MRPSYLRRRSSAVSGEETDAVIEKTFSSKNDVMSLLTFPPKMLQQKSWYHGNDDKEDLETPLDIVVYQIEDDFDSSSLSSGEEEDTYNAESKRKWCARSHPILFLEENKSRGQDSETIQYISQPQQDLETIKYMARREMTVHQERWNALTIIPSAIYCLCFLFSDKWMLLHSYIDDDDFQRVRDASHGTKHDFRNPWLGYFGEDETGCIPQQHWFARLFHWYALPPFPILAVAAGICFQAPFSFLYHWRYATQKVPTTHWSRRMDQSMIHFCSALISYATSGDVRYFLGNALFNLECIYRQFEPRVQPQRNQIRILISILLYLLPLLRRHQFEIFIELVLVLGISGWLFVAYPLGGWSHATFHLVVALAPPLLMTAALDLPISIQQVRLAFHCQDADADPSIFG